IRYRAKDVSPLRGTSKTKTGSSNAINTVTTQSAGRRTRYSLLNTPYSPKILRACASQAFLHVAKTRVVSLNPSFDSSIACCMNPRRFVFFIKFNFWHIWQAESIIVRMFDPLVGGILCVQLYKLSVKSRVSIDHTEFVCRHYI